MHCILCVEPVHTIALVLAALGIVTVIRGMVSLWERVAPEVMGNRQP